MTDFRLNSKLIIYFCVALFILIIGIVFFIYFMNFKATFETKYFADSAEDLVKVSRYSILNDFFYKILLFIFLSLSLFGLSFLFSYFLHKLLYTPLADLKQAMFEVRTENDLEVRLPVRGSGDIAEIYNEFNSMIKACRKQISIKHYVSDSTEKMVANLKTGEITTQPQRKDVTIFFSDVRGFTSYAEQNDPLEVIKSINEILSIQIKIINKYQGCIDKFIGDEIMAEFFNPSQAFKAAQEIQSKIRAFNKKRTDPLHVGIGIHCGEAVVGAIGYGTLYDWTIIGHTVNIGRRLCSSAGPEGIYISEQAFAKIKTKKAYEKNEIKVKGITQKITAYIFKK